MKKKANPPPIGEYIGVITNVASKSQARNSVVVTVAIWTGYEVVCYKKTFSYLFDVGRTEFQRFCEDFFLFIETEKGTEDDYELDLNEAIGCFCTATFSEDKGFESLSPAPENIEGLNVKKIFKNIKLFEPDESNSILKDYRMFPYNRDGYQAFFEYRGFITKVSVFDNLDTPDDETIRFTVATINSGNVKKFFYYINDIHTTGKYDLISFCEMYGITYEDDISVLKNILLRISTVKLFKAYKSDKIYVRSIEPYSYSDENEEVQYEVFRNSYVKRKIQQKPN